jgi:uncharacterized protein YktB (UPF0637 family)
MAQSIIEEGLYGSSSAGAGSQAPNLGFKPNDFAVFGIDGFGARMEKIYEYVRPRLTRLGRELAPELGRKLETELFAHPAKHQGRNPPPETWVAFGPSSRGYKRYGYLALCVSGNGLQARVVVKAEAARRAEMAAELEGKIAQLVKDFDGTKIARYEKWDHTRVPRATAAGPELFVEMARTLRTRRGEVDLGFGWTVREVLRLERSEVIEAFRELAPLYRVFSGGFREQPAAIAKKNRP